MNPQIKYITLPTGVTVALVISVIVSWLTLDAPTPGDPTNAMSSAFSPLSIAE